MKNDIKKTPKKKNNISMMAELSATNGNIFEKSHKYYFALTKENVITISLH